MKLSYRVRRRLAGARRWLVDHDNRWLFTILYVGFAVILSITISLFWLLAVVAAHGVLEYWTLTRRGMRRHRLEHVLWHIKLDIGLIIFALWLGVYMDVIFGVAGLSAAARTTAQAGSRLLAWQQGLRGVLITVDDAAVVARSVMRRRAGAANDAGSAGGAMAAPNAAAASGESTAESAAEPAAIACVTRSPWRGRWRLGDRLSIALSLVFGGLILLAPLLTDHSPRETVAALAQDLHPWPAAKSGTGTVLLHEYD